MNIPSLPSDSLYKYVAFFGMSLVLISIYFVFTEDRTIDQKMLDLNGQNRQIHKKDSLLWKDAKAIQEEGEYLSKRLGIRNLFTATDTSYSWTEMFKGSKEEELLSDTIKLLVQKFNEKQSQISQMGVDRDVNEYILDELQKNYGKDQIIFGVMLLVGAIISMIGFNYWYTKIQRPADIRAKTEALQIPPIADRCQSCGQRFEHYTVQRGTEADGRQNNFFCNTCYDKGVFVEPDISFADMKSRFIAELDKQGYRKWMKDNMLQDFKKLQRWNKEQKYE